MNHDQGGLIVHSRDIANSTWGLGINALRVLNLALRKVDSTISAPGEVKVNSRDYSLAYDVNKRSIHSVMRAGTDELINSYVTLDFDGGCHKLNWLESGDFSDGITTLRFSESIKPYLFDLESNVVAMDFNDVRKINHPFTFRLMQSLLQHRRIRGRGLCKKWVAKLSIDALYKMAPNQTRYESWFKTNEKLIKPALEKINAIQPYCITYKPIKFGRHIRHVGFNCSCEGA